MEFSVLQWNIWYQEDINNVAKFLKDHPADIICLQELTIGHPIQDHKDTTDIIAKSLGYTKHIKELPIETTDGKKIMLANGIFTKHSILSTNSAWINQPKGSGGYDDEFRALVQAQIDLGGKTVTVDTTHMSYTDRFQPTPSKLNETDELIKQLIKNKSNFIFTGDLNALPDSYTIKEVSKILKNSGPDVNQKTWTTKPFSYQGFEATTLDWRLDYVFSTPDLEVVKSEILDTEFSDHLPVLVTFRFK